MFLVGLIVIGVIAYGVYLFYKIKKEKNKN